MKAKRGAPKKPLEERKGQVVQIRLSAEDKALCKKAAALDDLKMSRWSRNVLVRAAKRMLNKRG